MNESGWKTLGKGFIEGFTFGIVRPSTEDEKFVNGFVDGLSHYGRQWDNIAPIIHKSVVQLNKKTYDEAIKFAIDKMRPLFDEFNNRDISLHPLLKQLKNGFGK